MSKRTLLVGLLVTMSVWSGRLLLRAGEDAVGPFVAASTAERISLTREERTPQSARTAANEPLSQAVHKAEFQSARPRCAKLALDLSPSRVLCIAFDESQGTGKGYDLLYADMNFDGVFEQAEKFKAKGLEREGRGISSSFPPIRLSVAYNEGAGDQAHWRIVFTQETPTTGPPVWTIARVFQRPVLSAERFGLTASVSIVRDSTRWRYFLNSFITPSGALNTAPIWSIGRDLKLQLTLQPDKESKGNLGIGINLTAGQNELACYKGGMPAVANVEVKGSDGTVVHKVEDALDKFGLG